MKYTDFNSKVVDSWVSEDWEWSIPISHETFLKAKNEKIWDVVLTPIITVPHSWFPSSLKGVKILGLASGGAQQMPIFSALGAECTVLDYSEKQLESERKIAEREGYKIDIVKYDMTKKLPFEDNYFDLIFHPVSNVYIEKVEPVFKECFRILKTGGAFLAGLDNGVNFIFDIDEKTVKYTLPFNPLTNKEHYDSVMKENDGYEFSHTVTEQIGGQLKAGFILTDIYEDTNSEGNLKEHNIKTFMATRSVKPI
ncbi:MAG: methyltransferase domain-containing protein [Sphaerochaetaceae bacterium]|nr:methyltransferase domain-containing protein [Sphaerochaetaceae bacterium]